MYKCNGDKIEDKIHFICDCSLYSAERLRLFDYVNHEISNFLTLNSFDKSIWLMTCENSEIFNRFADFLHTCFSMRDTA